MKAFAAALFCVLFKGCVAPGPFPDGDPIGDEAPAPAVSLGSETDMSSSVHITEHEQSYNDMSGSTGGGAGSAFGTGLGSASSSGSGGGSASVGQQYEGSAPAASTGVDAEASNCFSGDTLLKTPIGPKAMDELKIGDEVEVLSEEGLSFQPIQYFQHAEKNSFADYLQIRLEGGEKVKISPEHLIFFQSGAQCQDEAPQSNDGSLNGYFRLARRLLEGGGEERCLLKRQSDGSLAYDRILGVTTLPAKGVYAPITASGTVMANGILASTFTSVEWQELHLTAHALFGSFADWLLGASAYQKIVEAKSGVVAPGLRLIRHIALHSLPSKLV